MSCARENEVLQLETEWLAAAEQASIRAHLSQCPSCARTAELVSGSRANLRRTKQAAELTIGERRSIARALSEDRSEKPRVFIRWSMALAMSAAAAFAAITFSRPAPEYTPSPLLRDDLFVRGKRVILPEHARVRIAGAEVEAISTAELELAIDRDLLRISDGALAIALGDRGLITVLTPTLRIEGVGASFRVDVDSAKTSVIVEDGEVEVAPLDAEGEANMLARGESMIAALVEPTEGVQPAIAVAPPPPPQRTLREPEKIVEPPPEPEPAPEPVIIEPVKVDFAELVTRADAERRAGRLEEALAIYTAVANDPKAVAFAEEAMLRRASLLENLGNTGEALSALKEAGDRFQHGELVPERVLLEVKIYLEQNEASRAATSLEQLDDRSTQGILRARIDTARAIAESQPNRALALISPALSRDVSEAISRSARELEAEIRSREKK
jgi:ferric-dicitrate binding protein FerR (iron transport regulator)